MKNTPKKIWLNVGDDPGDDFSELSEVTWCDTHQFDDDLAFIHISELENFAEYLQEKMWKEPDRDLVSFIPEFLSK